MKKVGEVLLFVLGGIVKAVTYLFVTLGLWLPALFAVSFFIATAVMHTPLTSRVMGVFYVGLVLTLAGGIWLAMAYSPALKKRRAEKRLKEKQHLAEVKAKTRALEEAEAEEPASETASTRTVQPPRSEPPVERAENTQRSEPEPAPSAKQEDYSDLYRKYFADTTQSTRPQNGANQMSQDAERLWARLSGNEAPDEQPLVFRMRSDENLFVYEFSDRYQYWRRTTAGMRLERTQFKSESPVDATQGK